MERHIDPNVNDGWPTITMDAGFNDQIVRDRAYLQGEFDRLTTELLEANHLVAAHEEAMRSGRPVRDVLLSEEMASR